MFRLSDTGSYMMLISIGLSCSQRVHVSGSYMSELNCTTLCILRSHGLHPTSVSLVQCVTVHKWIVLSIPDLLLTVCSGLNMYCFMCLVFEMIGSVVQSLYRSSLTVAFKTHQTCYAYTSDTEPDSDLDHQICL